MTGLAQASSPASQPAIKQAADYIEWGRLKEARDLLAGAVSQPANANDAALLAFYGHVVTMFGDFNQGMNLTKKAVALDANCATCHLYLFEAMAERAKTLSQVRALLVLPKLRKQLQKADELGPRLGDVQWGWIDLDLGLPAAVGGSAQDAFAHADKLSQIDPVDGHLARASIYAYAKKPDQELAEYQAAATEHPNDPRGVFAYGQALAERGEYAKAEPLLARASQMSPGSVMYSGYEAAALVHLGRLEQARTVIEDGQRVHPASRLGEYLTAQALKDTGKDFAWARQLLDAYLTVPPEPQQPTAAEARQLLASLG
ncbi:MAG TPA: hypothetical protein VN515_02195 [Terriglobales bacterium]|nr:hypothetical protein [Terriglobales bacterium]